MKKKTISSEFSFYVLSLKAKMWHTGISTGSSVMERDAASGTSQSLGPDMSRWGNYFASEFWLSELGYSSDLTHRST